MPLFVSLSRRVLWHFIAVSSLSTTILVGSWQFIRHKLHLRGWLLSRNRSCEALWVCASCYYEDSLNTRSHHTYVYYTCILNTYTGTHSCTQRGLAHRGSGFCQKCPKYMHSPPGSTSMSDCKCKSGFYLKTGVFECMACPTGTKSPSGSTSQDDCKCAAGYYKTASQLNISCIRCPGSSDSAEGSTTIEKCICPPGLGIAGNSYSRRVTSPNDICGVEIRYIVAGIQHAMSVLLITVGRSRLSLFDVSQFVENV